MRLILDLTHVKLADLQDYSADEQNYFSYLGQDAVDSWIPMFSISSTDNVAWEMRWLLWRNEIDL